MLFGFFLNFLRKSSVERPKHLNLLVGLQYLDTLHRKDQRDSLQGNHDTEEQKVDFKQDTLQKLKEN